MNLDFSINILYRFVMKLPITLFRYARRVYYPFSEDSKELELLKNKFIGQRCFIIGNGPSLTISDLDRLQNEFTFATNRIYHVFSKTNWRPSFYLSIDNNVLKDNLDKIIKIKGPHKFINITAKAYGFKKENDTTFINMFGPYLLKPYAYETKKVCGDISKSFSYSYSVTGVAIELAVYMGFKEIYLIGVDNNYSSFIDKEGKIYTDGKVKNYFGDLETKSYTINYRDATNSYYSAFEKYAKKNGIIIKNATRGGNLNEFERINFDQVISVHNEK